MNTIESFLFYTKVLTALVLVLNIALVLCIHLNIRCIKRLRNQGPDGESRLPITPVEPGKATGILVLLILTVILLNGAAIFTNHRLLAAADDLTTQFSMPEIAPAKEMPITQASAN